MSCNCTLECLPLVGVKCTSCQWVGEERLKAAEKHDVGQKFPLGETFKCPGCNRRKTCVGKVIKKGEPGCKTF